MGPGRGVRGCPRRGSGGGLVIAAVLYGVDQGGGGTGGETQLHVHHLT